MIIIVGTTDLFGEYHFVSCEYIHITLPSLPITREGYQELAHKTT